jgi:hypothetical protein
LIPKIAHFVILTPTGNYRFLKFKSVKNNPFRAIYACVVEARPWYPPLGLLSEFTSTQRNIF